MSCKALLHDRQGAVSVLFAGAAVPILGMIGLSIDFAVLAQAKTQMALAADTAALSSVKVASNAFAGGDSNWQSEAQTNGLQWFAAQVGGAVDKKKSYSTLRSGVISNIPTVAVNRSGVNFTTQVNYTGVVPTTFSGLFGVSSINIAGSVSASVALNAYVNIALLIDNSSSMLVGATTSDINTLQAITACSPESTHSNQGTGSWTGPVVPATCPTTYVSTSGGSPPVAGQGPKSAACGFACHWSNNNQKTVAGAPDYTQYDFYALARNPGIGAITGYGAPTLRFDVVQSATANVVSTMKSSEVISNQFGLSVFEFNASLTQVYPATGTESSTDLDSGLSAVQGITTPVVANDGDTNFPSAMTSIKNLMANAGDGSDPATPRKNLFIITDGIQDYGSRAVGDTLGPMNNSAATAACNAIKAKGISIYVLYTPYTPLPYNPFYKSNIDQFVVTPPTPNKISQALQACASSPTNFYEADLPSQVTTGLQRLLKAAVRSAARISS